jgi:predicted nucleotidyltransferase
MMSERDGTSTTVRIRPDVITDEFLATLRAHGVVRAHLFGSVSRGEERPDSDLDLLVEFSEERDSLLEQFWMSEELGRLCGRRVDVLTKIHPAFEPYITPTLIPLPL